MRVILDVVQGPHKGQTYVWNRPGCVVMGRSTSVPFSMEDDHTMSREHLEIELTDTGCVLRDLGSTNGTFVNEKRVDAVLLRTGDRIAAGQSILAVRLEGLVGVGVAPTVLAATPKPSGALPRLQADTEEAPVLATIRCAGCGTSAPPGLDVAGNDPEMRESIQWLCDHCRVEAAVSPQVVSHYKTLRELGRGAMGVVYLAQQVVTSRKVALKVIAPETAAARSSIDRFLREMTVISQLKHPNIVEYLEQGVTRGRFWFAMEYVNGSSLEQVATAQRGTYPIHQACRMASQVLKGLEHAHRLGFVHRDIKPENILIGREGANLIAKISDFGLAKNYRSFGLSALTFSGEMRGTIPFMPPEQMVEFKKVQPSGDLYSTAATLYYLISGQYIYDQPAEGGGDLLRMLMEENPVPIRERRGDVPPALEAVLQKCLMRDPADRYPDATAMRAALRPYCQRA
jgi:serine/threonine-protein kinase